jgi:hypothetical protein
MKVPGGDGKDLGIAGKHAGPKHGDHCDRCANGAAYGCREQSAGQRDAARAFRLAGTDSRSMVGSIGPVSIRVRVSVGGWTAD